MICPVLARGGNGFCRLLFAPARLKLLGIEFHHPCGMNAPDPANSSATPLQRSWLWPQFSLRALLLAFTGVAIGFPVWYQWPIQETKLKYPRVYKKVGANFIEVEDNTAPPETRTVTTWRRRLGKGWVKHGRQTWSHETPDNGRRQVVVRNYESDKLQGPFSRSYDGVPQQTGQFERGSREGTWVTVDSHTGQRSSVPWHRDQIHGQAEIRGPDGEVTRMQFDRGMITHLNDQPVSSPLLGRIRRGEIESSDMLAALQSEASTIIVALPLSEWIGMMDDAHYVPIALGPKVADTSVPISGRVPGINLQAALVVLMQRHGLDCDYRYGCLWITSAEDAREWEDPTGVTDIQPRLGTSLATAWNEPVKTWRFDKPLAESAAGLCEPLAVDIDTTQVAPTPDNPARFPVRIYLNINGNYLPLRHLLGILLYKTGCRCKLDGSRLVILPPEDG